MFLPVLQTPSFSLSEMQSTALKKITYKEDFLNLYELPDTLGVILTVPRHSCGLWFFSGLDTHLIAINRYSIEIETMLSD